MIKILFICHGNICRSTMAEAIMKHMVKQRGVADDFEIDSAATTNEEIGNQMYPPAQRKLRAEGVPVGNHRARRVTPADYEYYDYLLAMDEENLCHMRRILGEDTEGKIHLLLSYAGENREIADPWYTGNFDDTYDDLVKGLNAFYQFIKNN